MENDFVLNARSRGRPREFDVDDALDRAIKVFSERGYHGTSIADLTEAMQLAQGSVYKAFKDKRNVFLAAFTRYRAVRAERFQRAVGSKGTGFERVRNALEFYVASSLGAEGRQGCLVVGSAVELAACDAEIAQRVTTALASIEALLVELIQQGQEDGSIAAHLDSKAAARMLLCLTQGLRVVGKTGRSRKDLLAAVNIALKILE
jgi:TetR/AcrR family transcriptional repressor of nem operon